MRNIDLEQQFTNDFSTVDKSGRKTSVKIYEYLKGAIYNLESFMKAHSSYEIVGVEQEFTLDLFGHPFHGFIDRVFHDTATDTYIIQDIKTYAVPIEPSKLEIPLQFVIYSLAAQQLYQCTQSQIYCQYYLPFCNLTQDITNRDFVQAGLEVLKSIFCKIDNNQFEPNPTALCNYCPYCKTNPDATKEFKTLCPYYCLWERVRRKKGDLHKVNHSWEGLENDSRIVFEHKKRSMESL